MIQQKFKRGQIIYWDGSKHVAMGRWERLVRWFAYHFNYRTIYGECSELYGYYLRRFFIYGFSGENKEHKGWSVYLHHIRRSDLERDLHDHPWNFVSILLTGSYVEITPFDSTRYRAGDILFRPAEWQHRLEIKKPMWTLVILMPKKRSWGFATKNGLVHHSAYGYRKDC